MPKEPFCSDATLTFRYWGKPMEMNEYRCHAAECLVIADDITTSPKNRILLIAMAQAWLRLAQQAEAEMQQPSPSIEPPGS